MPPYPSTAKRPLANRVAVVSGASSGLGAATAHLLAARGAKVALLARRKDLLDQHVAAISASGGHAIAIAADVTDQAAVNRAVKTITAEFGVVNLVVNNASAMLDAPITDIRIDDWANMIAVNLTGALRITGAFIPLLLEAAAEGCAADLVNVSSIAAQNIYPNLAVYSATKAATSHLSRHLQAELGVSDVRVSTIEPGMVSTELHGQCSEKIDCLTVEDIAQTIAFMVALPRHVNLQQVTIMPTRQAT